MPFEYYEFIANPHQMILAHSECISSRMQLECSWNTVGQEQLSGSGRSGMLQRRGRRHLERQRRHLAILRCRSAVIRGLM